MRRIIVTALTLAALLPLPSWAASVTVKPGDTLSQIAARHNVSLKALMRLNGITNSDHVVAGSTLKLPGSSSSNTNSGSGRHKVTSGETLSSIAARYKVRQQDLIALNNLRDANNIYIGQTLKLPGSASNGIRASASRHKVTRGETLGTIAVRYKVRQQDLIALNNLRDANHVELGQTLKLPQGAVIPKPKPTAKPKPVAIKAKPNATSHTVARGQTLTQIARAYDVSVASLISINNIANPNKLLVGTKLSLRAKPPVETKPKPTTEIATKPTAKPTTQIADKPAAKPETKPTTEVATKPSKNEWRTYGPLQVDWANWKLMGGSYVAPTLNKKGKPLYLAVNCPARKLNTTGANGSWKTWNAPQERFERDLVKDLCKAKGG
ncbi:MAG: LysM peptidoglycan-binding domain-containing protein [Prochlorococcaceae cyanobacterium ETNP18_MAG_17]|nr:LysM peptidoglycan-binding domain-containing protein [Prochlorococcaceae cyanobacterium ETNP18_MAG_17]